MEEKTIQIKTEKRTLVAILLDWVWSFVIALVVAFVITRFIATPARVSQTSMTDTLQDQDFLIVSKFNQLYPFLFGDYQIGDIVCFQKKGTQDLLVKRIIGMPGDTIVIKDGEVYRNGVKMIEPYLNAKNKDKTYAIGSSEQMMYDSMTYNVPEGKYFVMGDNRNGSIDSRFSSVSYITRESMIGKATFRLFPINTFGGL